MAKDLSVSENGWVVVAGSTDGLWVGGNTSTGREDFVAVMLGIDGSSYLDGDGAGSGGDVGTSSAGGDSGNGFSSSAPEPSSDSSTNSGDGGGDTGGSESNYNNTTLAPEESGGSSSVSMIVGALVAVAVLGVFLVGLGWAWRKKRSERRAGANKKAQTTHFSSSFSSKHPAGMNDGSHGGCPRWKSEGEQGSADPPADGVIGNPLFDHPNSRTIPSAADVSAAAAGGPGGGGDSNSGRGSSWKDRGLTAFPSVSAGDDVSR